MITSNLTSDKSKPEHRTQSCYLSDFNYSQLTIVSIKQEKYR